MGTVCREAVNDCDIRETCSGNSSQVTYESFLWIQGGKSWSLVNWPSDGMEMGKIFMFLFRVNSFFPFINFLELKFQ